MRNESFCRTVFATLIASTLSVWPAYAVNAGTDGMAFVMESNSAAANGDAFKWEKNKAVPLGMLTIMIYGSPKLPGPFIFRAKMPAGYQLPPHRHPDDRTVTVLDGTYLSGTGVTYDQTKMTAFKMGAFYITKAGTPHFAFAQTDVVIQESGVGPDSGIEYVNLRDDPRKD